MAVRAGGTAGPRVRPGGLPRHGLSPAARLAPGADPVRFSTIDYEGVARVENPARLQAAMAHGVGRARRYGCGLLLVRPA
nr:type I-E CRISPR-associated protein Cas6/Cse3/CasE [Hankyongella ginsenosidimutans]